MTLKRLTKNNFNAELLQAKTLVLVDYWSPTCGPCEMYNQVLETLQLELEGSVKIYQLNVDDEIEIANQEGILVMPTTKIYFEGECVKELLGVQTPNEVRSALESLRRI